MTPDELALLVAELRAGPLLPAGRGEPVTNGAQEVLDRLPHRAPMLLLDAIDAVDPERGRLRARRRIASDDPIFAGHFPERAIYPGVLLVEMVGQAGSCLLSRAPTEVKQLIRLHHALFLAPVGPDDLTEVHAAVMDVGLTTIVAGQVYRGETLCALAVLELF